MACTICQNAPNSILAILAFASADDTSQREMLVHNLGHVLMQSCLQSTDQAPAAISGAISFVFRSAYNQGGSTWVPTSNNM